MVGKHEAKLLGEHLSSVDFTAPSKTFSRPAARGPGVSAIGGAGVGDGERESAFVAEGILNIAERRRGVSVQRFV
jgi:F0F1-type ATP synthase beta subunit